MGNSNLQKKKRNSYPTCKSSGGRAKLHLFGEALLIFLSCDRRFVICVYSLYHLFYFFNVFCKVTNVDISQQNPPE